MLIRQLDPSEAPLVGQFYSDAPEYWLLAEGAFDPDIKAQEFFTDVPPSCDPEQSHPFGLFLGIDPLLTGFYEELSPKLVSTRSAIAPHPRFRNNISLFATGCKMPADRSQAACAAAPAEEDHKRLLRRNATQGVPSGRPKTAKIW